LTHQTAVVRTAEDWFFRSVEPSGSHSLSYATADSSAAADRTDEPGRGPHSGPYKTYTAMGS
jgi:hypothetical protein